MSRSTPLALEVIKGGVIIDTIDLKCVESSSYEFGREEKQSTESCKRIVLAHPSISRTHARIISSSSKNSTLILTDLHSTYGTKVNKSVIKGDTVINIGDVIKFGESTRLYTLIQRQSCPGINWGMQEQGLQEEEEDNDDLPLVEAKVHKNDRGIWNAITAKRLKIENLREESDRILAKDNLTTGQQAVVTRNKSRVEELERDIQDMEDSIKSKNAQRQSKNASFAYESSSDDDDFYDRTKNRTTTTNNNSTETCGTLREKVQYVSSQLASTDGDLQNLLASISNKEEEEEEDTLDAFMQQSKTESLEADIKAATAKRTELVNELSTLQSLLDIATPAMDKLVTVEQQRIIPQTVEKPVVVPKRKAKPEDEVIVVPKKKKAKKKPVGVQKTNTLEGGDVAWLPPEGQTGDGRTSLNDKFGY